MLNRFRHLSSLHVCNKSQTIFPFYRSISYKNRTVDELAEDVRAGLRDNVIMPFDSVINISTVLASKQYYRYVIYYCMCMISLI